MALHDPGEALALGGAGDVDLLAGLEELDGDLLADRVVGSVGGAELDEVAARGDAGLLEVAGHRLVDLARVDGAERHLDGAVAVALGAADLRDDTGAGLDDRHGDQAVVSVPDLGHAELLAQDALDGALSSVSHGRVLRA